MNILASDLPLVLLGDDGLHWLRIVDPFEGGEAVANRHDPKSFETQVPVLARRIRRKYLIHDTEELFDSLVEAQVLATLHEQVVVLLIASVHRDPLWSANGAEDEADFLETGDLDVLLDLWLVTEVRSFILSWDLDVALGLVELVAVELVHPFGVCGEARHSLVQVPLADLLVDCFKLRHQLDQGHAADARAIPSKSLDEGRLKVIYELAIVLADVVLDEGLAAIEDVVEDIFDDFSDPVDQDVALSVELLSSRGFALPTIAGPRRLHYVGLHRRVLVRFAKALIPVLETMLREDQAVKRLRPAVEHLEFFKLLTQQVKELRLRLRSGLVGEAPLQVRLDDLVWIVY